MAVQTCATILVGIPVRNLHTYTTPVYEYRGQIDNDYRKYNVGGPHVTAVTASKIAMNCSDMNV